MHIACMVEIQRCITTQIMDKLILAARNPDLDNLLDIISRLENHLSVSRSHRKL